MRQKLWYDTIEESNIDSKAERGQLNLAHVARKRYWKKETKTNKRLCPLSLVQVKNREGSPEGTTKTTEEKICETDDRN